MLKKSLLLNLLAVLVGMGAIVLLEVALYLADAGPSSRLFLASHRDGEVVYEVNPHIGHRFFQQQYRRPVPYNPSFPQKKPPDAVRIFVLGASTLLGFPNPPNTAFPHFLAEMLADVYPDRHFEVINCGMTAINTFCLLDFAAEVVGYEPDLIILYAGHNEFVGPYGVTTPFRKFGNNRTWTRLYMELQRSRIYYFLSEAIYRLQKWWNPTEKKFGLHLVGREIGLLDEEHRVTAENYRDNLGEILLQARQHGTPVLISTLVANLKDFYPLRSDCNGGDLSQELDGLVRQGRLQEAIAVCEEALDKDPYCAGIHFELGRLHYRRGEYSKAHRAFVYARDMDRLPFRAPAVFNQIIRKLAGTAKDQVLLSDVEKVFAANSPHGIVGNELIAEYLHPTVYGHYLIARSMVEDLVQSSVGANWGEGDTGKLKNYEAYAHQLGYSLWDRVFYRNDLILFLRNMPYREPPPILRRYVAELMGRQIEDISQFEATQRRNFAEQKGMVFLFRMVDFLLPEDRRAIEERLRNLTSEVESAQQH